MPRINPPEEPLECRCFYDPDLDEMDPCNCEVPGHCPEEPQPEPEYHEFEPADVLELHKQATEGEW